METLRRFHLTLSTSHTSNQLQWLENLLIFRHLQVTRNKVACFGVPLKQVKFCKFCATPQTHSQNLERFQHMTKTLYLKTERPNMGRCMILRKTKSGSCCMGFGQQQQQQQYFIKHSKIYISGFEI